jgi:hypothetical protein
VARINGKSRLTPEQRASVARAAHRRRLAQRKPATIGDLKRAYAEYLETTA